jgi:hypothetical protein
MYQLNEGSIELPAEWKDQSINIISSAGGAAPGLSFTVTRDDIPWGMQFSEYVADEIAKAKEALNDFTILSQDEIRVSDAPAVQIECTWNAKQGQMHQIITTVHAAPRAMVLTASMPGKMSASQKETVRKIVSTLSLHKREG